MGFRDSSANVEEHHYYDTYYFCNAISNILANQISYIRPLDDYYGDERVSKFASSFPKFSHFHDFIEFVVRDIYMDEMDSSNIEEALKLFKSHTHLFPSKNDESIMSFVMKKKLFMEYLLSKGVQLCDSTEADLEDFYHCFFWGDDFEKHLEKTVREVFYILFGNRKIIRIFNEMISSVREDNYVEGSHDPQYETKKGYLKRVNIPQWVQRAVFYRDKGVCVICKKDITGLINSFNKKNYDHIVPLARFGMNDVSNIQLLCEECNGNKKAKNNDSSNDYFPWYTI